MAQPDPSNANAIAISLSNGYKMVSKRIENRIARVVISSYRRQASLHLKFCFLVAFANLERLIDNIIKGKWDKQSNPEAENASLCLVSQLQTCFYWQNFFFLSIPIWNTEKKLKNVKHFGHFEHFIYQL